MKWIKIEPGCEMPNECEVVVLKGTHDDLDESFVMAAMIFGEFVTDATVSEIYGCEGHSELVDFEPKEWAYIK